METQEILKKVKTGEISVEEAELFFRRQSPVKFTYNQHRRGADYPNRGGHCGGHQNQRPVAQAVYH